MRISSPRWQKVADCYRLRVYVFRAARKIFAVTNQEQGIGERDVLGVRRELGGLHEMLLGLREAALAGEEHAQVVVRLPERRILGDGGLELFDGLALAALLLGGLDALHHVAEGLRVGLREDGSLDVLVLRGASDDALVPAWRGCLPP